MKHPFSFVVTLALAAALAAQPTEYRKIEAMVPMRDGTKLYTGVYVPTNRPGKHPMLMERTGYGAGPYGEGRGRNHRGSIKMREAGYIFVYQDVRGRGMSEGEFEHIRPQLSIRWLPHDVDESTDTYDTVDWLVKNVPDNNGRVGQWGISYPGGYAALGALNNHPALKAISPQAPTADWFLGDDFHHNGVFFLQDAFSFLSGFDAPRSGPGGPRARLFSFNMEGDAYKFFLDLGPLRNTQDEKYFGGRSRFWNDMFRHGTYDEFWQARSVPANMRNVTASILTVGGWFDAEDLYGALAVYKATEAQNKGIFNALCMGPWSHGGWAGPTGDRLGDVLFGSMTSRHYQDEIEFKFFDACLRGDGKPPIAEANVFETGANQWRTFDAWPPTTARSTAYYFDAAEKLVLPPPKTAGAEAYESDPSNPVPYEGGKLGGRSSTYMIADQRFADERPDVLTYATAPLEEDVTWAGPVRANLFVETTSTDADFVVKIVDVQPKGSVGARDKDLSDAQILVRGEIMRAKFRNSYSNPQPLTPGKVETVSFALPDVLHTFKKGHRIMVQVQSSWFPLADRNPQTFGDIYSLGPEAFVKSTIRIHRGGVNLSGIEVGVLPKP